jgi:hypothetical protein
LVFNFKNSASPKQHPDLLNHLSPQATMKADA